MKISFDFDGTLEYDSVQKVARELIDEGHDVCILTTRYSKPWKYSSWDVSEDNKKYLQDQFDKLNEIADNLGIKEINYSEFQWKFTVIDNLGIDVHVDDNFREEVAEINHRCKARAVYYGPYEKDWVANLRKLIDENNN